jgi:hypothetical protein
MSDHPAARERHAQAALLFTAAAAALQNDWEFFKAALTGSIVLGHSVCDLIRAQSARAPGFKQWYSALEIRHPTLGLFRDERNYAIHQRLTALHGLGHRNAGIRLKLQAEGEEPPPEPPQEPIAGTTREAYFDAAHWSAKPAVDYVADYLDELERVIREAEASF